MTKPMPKEPTHAELPATRALTIAAVLVALLLLGLGASYLARSSWVVGDRVAARLTALAERHRVDLQIAAMHPEGLTGVIFHDVKLTVDRGEFILNARFDELAVAPDLRFLVEYGRLAPGDVEISGGSIYIERTPGRRTPPTRAAPAPPTTAAAAPLAAPGPSPGLSSPQKSAEPPGRTPLPPRLPSTRAILRDIEVSIHLAPLPATIRALDLQRAELLVRSRADQLHLDNLNAYGVLPDGIPFAVHELDAAPDSSPEFTFKPQQATQLERWFNTDAPLAISVGGLQICPNCAPTRVVLEQVDLGSAGALGVRSDQATIEFGDARVESAVAQMELYEHQTSAPVALIDDAALRYDRASDTATLTGELRDATGGSMRGTARWLRADDLLVSDVEFDAFEPHELLSAIGIDQRLRPGQLDGRLMVSLDRQARLLNTGASLDVHDLRLDLPFIAASTLSIPRLHLQAEALADLDHRSASLSTMRVSIDDLPPVTAQGYVADAVRGWAFEATLSADQLDPSALRDRLPLQVARVLEEAEITGTFDFRLATSGYTASPDSLHLDLDFGGDVQVLKDSVHADIGSLATDGPPPADLGGPASPLKPRQWVSYHDLPPYVPHVITSAEDAQFYDHHGFDWRGLRQAMVHNLQEGRFARGGSTISQQVAKNIFLRHDRTLTRKLQEAYITWRLEAELSKERIFELYANIVEWAPGVRGIRAAAQHYFGLPIEQLGVEQTALLAAILPAPNFFGPLIEAGLAPHSRVAKTERILENLSFLGHISFGDYLRLTKAARAGRFGSLKLTVCRDEAAAPNHLPACDLPTSAN